MSGRAKEPRRSLLGNFLLGKTSNGPRALENHRLARVLGVGLLLALLWTTFSYSFLHPSCPSTTKQKQNRAETILAQAKELMDDGEHSPALLALNNALKLDPKNGKILLEKGRCLLQLGKMNQAFSQIKLAVESSKDSWEAHLEFAKLAIAGGLLKTAKEHADKARALNPDISEPYLILAHCLNGEGLDDGARENLETAVSMIPENDTFQLEFAARLYRSLGEPELASQFFHKALDINTDFIEARIGLAYLLMDQSDWEKTRLNIDQVLANDEKNRQAMICLAEWYMAQKEHQNAITEYEKVIKLYPDFPESRTRLAALYFFAGEQELGMSQLDWILSQYPNYSPALILSASTHLKQKRFQLAAIHAERISSRDSRNYFPAQQILAQASVKQKQYQKAVDACQNFLAEFPNAFLLKLLLGYSYHQLGELEKAVLAYREAVEINDKSSEPNRLLGLLLYEQEKYHEAISNFRQAFQKAPDNWQIGKMLTLLLMEQDGEEYIVEAHDIALGLKNRFEDNPIIVDTYGWALFHQGELKNAEQAFNRAIKMDPTLPEPYYHLGKTLVEQNKLQASQQALQKSLQLASRFRGAIDAKKLLQEIQEKEPL